MTPLIDKIIYLSIDPTFIKGLATVISLIGSGILALRISNFVKTLGYCIDVHQSNFDRMNSSHPIIITGITKWVENAQRVGWFITGFVCYVVSGLLQLYAMFI